MPSYLVDTAEIQAAVQIFFSDAENKRILTNINWDDNVIESFVNLLNFFKILDDGTIISSVEAQAMRARFEGSPSSYELSNTLLVELINELNKINIAKHFPAYELALRVCIGLKAEPTNNTNPEYSIVIVPSCSPMILFGEKRDHAKDLENSLLIRHGKFFALIAHIFNGTPFVNMTDNKHLCANAVRYADISGKQIIYYSLAQFKNFYNGIIKIGGKISKLVIYLGRDKDNNITVLLQAIDKDGNPLPSEMKDGSVKVTGVYFDKGDLIPPPDAIPDRSF